MLLCPGMIKTRFAPSPTGELHIGGVRSALFVYLFAKSKGGDFLLRIDDTDRERYVEGSVERIIESLNWLGIVPDNLDNLVVQSERKELYHKYAKQLLDQGDAYICTCSKEQLEKDKEEQVANKLPPMYSGRCRESNIRLEDVKEGEYVIRMKMPKGEIIKFHDLIRGDIEFDSSLIDDQVLIKSDGFPTYHLATVIDDHLMEISHIIRAEEWLSSTPKHLVLFRMLGWEAPEIAHLSQVLNKDKKKLSKRDGAASVIEYKKLGFLPEALRNFIVLLGWHPKDETEVFETMDSIIGAFEFERIQKAGAVFDMDKLNWFNRHYIANVLSLEELTERAREFVPSEWSLTQEIMASVRSRLDKLSDLKEMISFFFELPEYAADDLYWKETKTAKENLEAVLEKISALPESGFSKTAIEEINGIVPSDKKGEWLWPLRVALSGKRVSPSPFEIIAGLSKEETLRRIRLGIEKL